MTGARLRSTRSAWPCAGQAMPHRPQKRAAMMTRGECLPPLILSCEQKRQVERGRQQGLLPVRAGTLGPVSAASKARPVGVALNLEHLHSLILQRVLKLHLKALAYNLENLAQCQVETDLAVRSKEVEIVQCLYDLLKEVNEINIKNTQ